MADAGDGGGGGSSNDDPDEGAAAAAAAVTAAAGRSVERSDSATDGRIWQAHKGFMVFILRPALLLINCEKQRNRSRRAEAPGCKHNGRARKLDEIPTSSSPRTTVLCCSPAARPFAYPKRLSLTTVADCAQSGGDDDDDERISERRRTPTTTTKGGREEKGEREEERTTDGCQRLRLERFGAPAQCDR